MKPTLMICAVEFSAEGRAVLAMAARLARWYEAKLHVVHLGARVRSQNKSVTARTVDHDLSARLDDFIAAVNLEGTTVESAILQGDAVRALVDYTRSISGSLTVVAQNGRPGSPFWSGGTFAKAIARGAGCPTISVPGHSGPKAGTDAPFKNVVCGVDLSESSAPALDYALEYAQQSHARLTLLHVTERGPQDVHDLRLKLKALIPAEALNACEVDIDIGSGRPREAILATAAARAADLIVIGQSQAAFNRVVMASTVGGVLRRAQCPVLIVPEASISPDRASRSTGVLASQM